MLRGLFAYDGATEMISHLCDDNDRVAPDVKETESTLNIFAIYFFVGTWEGV